MDATLDDKSLIQQAPDRRPHVQALKRCLSYVRSKDNALELSNSRPSNIGVRIEAQESSERLSCSLPRPDTVYEPSLRHSRLVDTEEAFMPD